MKTSNRFASIFVSLLFLLNGCGGSSGGSGGNSASLAPTNVSATRNGATGITIGWSPVSGATGYYAYRSNTANQLASAMTKVNLTPVAYGSLPFYDTGLTSGTTYYYKVTSIVGGAETPSLEVSAVTATASPLTQMGGSLQGNPLTLTNSISMAASGFSSPSFITTDGNYVYVTDQGTRSVLKVDPGTGVAAVMLGNGTCGVSLCSPRGLVTDGTNLFIVDETGGGNGSVVKIVLSTGVASTFISTGLYLPTSIKTDGVNLYIGDFYGIKKVNIATSAYSVLTTTPIHDLTTDGNYLYVLNGNAVQKVDMVTGTTFLYAGSVVNPGSADGIGGLASLRSPYCITSDGTSLYVTQFISSLNSLPVRKIDIATATVSTISSVTFALGITTDGVRIYDTTEVASGLVTTGLLNRLQ